MSPRAALALRRAARRQHERGATMFVVAMTLAVLGSVGVYAIAASATEARTAGNERQNTQTHYLSEYGVIGITHELVSSKAQFYLGLMMKNPDTVCTALPGVTNTAPPITQACRRLGSAELGQPWAANTITVPYASTTPYTSGVTPGSFGPIPMSGDFFVELTEPLPAQAATRYAKNLNFCFMQMTATSAGITQPIIAGQPTGVYANEGVEVQRARLIVGPIQACQ
jgi:hypothetical protein